MKFKLNFFVSNFFTGGVFRLSVSVLVFLSLFAAGLNRVEPDLLVVLLQGGQVLTGLGELSLLHALTDVPVQKFWTVVGFTSVVCIINAITSVYYDPSVVIFMPQLVAYI